MCPPSRLRSRRDSKPSRSREIARSACEQVNTAAAIALSDADFRRFLLAVLAQWPGSVTVGTVGTVTVGTGTLTAVVVGS
jgi:hypothetical protein